MEIFTAADLGKCSVVALRYCNNHLKICQFKIKYWKKTGSGFSTKPSDSTFQGMIKMMAQPIYHWCIADINLAAIDIGSINLKLLCCQDGIYLSYGYLVIFSLFPSITDCQREQNHPSFLSL